MLVFLCFGGCGADSTYCGAKVLISNENEYVFRQVDEAGIQKAETERLIKLKELELQEQREIHGPIWIRWPGRCICS